MKKHLIADDNDLNRLVIKIHLENNNCQVTEVPNGKEVVELIDKGNEYDVIWLDVNMPVLDGIECASILRNKYKYKKPIIGVTSNNDNDTLHNCAKNGMNDMLIKPFFEEDIVKLINQK